MTKRYLGNIITQNPTPPANNYGSTSAAGVWSLAEAFAYSKAGLWPTAGNVQQRAIYAGGQTTGGAVNVIEFFNFASTGNSSDFGDLTQTRGTGPAGIGGETRGIIAGAGASVSRSIDYITITSAGNAADFGDLINRIATDNTTDRSELGGLGNSTRGVIVGSAPLSGAGGFEYLTIATLGDTVDFGDTTSNNSNNQCRGAGSSTRGIFGAFQSDQNQMEYFTFATTGNSIIFGTLSGNNFANSAVVSSSTRCVWMGGQTTTDKIEYVTIATTGNASDFGDLSAARRMGAGASNGTIGTIIGGDGGVSPFRVNIIEQITIGSTGNATDWGDLTAAKRQGAGLSNSHGGLAA